MTSPSDKPLPFITESSADFWEGTRRGEFLIQRCSQCDTPRFPPKPVCSSCWSTESREVAAAGTGTVHTFTVIHRAGLPSFREEVPYVIAMVDLDEGVRVMANLDGDPEAVEIGMPVKLRFEERNDEITMYAFEPA